MKRVLTFEQLAILADCWHLGIGPLEASRRAETTQIRAGTFYQNLTRMGGWAWKLLVRPCERCGTLFTSHGMQGNPRPFCAPCRYRATLEQVSAKNKARRAERREGGWIRKGGWRPEDDAYLLAHWSDPIASVAAVLNRSWMGVAQARTRLRRGRPNLPRGVPFGRMYSQRPRVPRAPEIKRHRRIPLSKFQVGPVPEWVGNWR